MLMFEKPLYLQTIGIKPISYEHTKHIENLRKEKRLSVLFQLEKIYTLYSKVLAPFHWFAQTVNTTKI